MSKIDDMFKESKTLAEYSEKYCRYLSGLLSKIDHKKVQQIGNMLIETLKNNNTVFFIGNGGSATTSSHLACDLGKGTKTKNLKFKVQALADNLATFTAYANDEGYESVFSGQLENSLEKGDIVIAISASGNSQNLVKAVKYAKSVGAITIGFLGFDGGILKDMVDVPLVIETTKGEYGPVEDIHLVLGHIITTYIYRKMEKKEV